MCCVLPNQDATVISDEASGVANKEWLSIAGRF